MESGEKKSNPVFAWIFRLIKGVAIGTGFILPGVSGGVLAAIFGVYEKMIHFFANIRKDFKENVFFFFPIGVGALISIVLISRLLDTFFKVAEVQLIWFFIGCVAGTFPSLFKQAGREGRKSYHFVILLCSAVVGYIGLFFLKDILSAVKIPTDNIFVWLLAGGLMGLGAIVPGLSPSNFLIYLHMYEDMVSGMKDINLVVLIPVVVGAGLCFLLLSKLFDWMFDKMYAGLYHFILGIIIASTVMIVPFAELPENFSYSLSTVPVCAVVFLAGGALGYIMGLLEKKYKS